MVPDMRALRPLCNLLSLPSLPTQSWHVSEAIVAVGIALVARSRGACSLLQEAILRMLADVATGLDYLHSVGIVHGDIKAG